MDYETDMDKVMTVLNEYWKMRLPNVLISVTGGAEKMSMQPGLKETLSRLVEVAHDTGSWIITGGTNVGVMKLVGEAVRERLIADGSNTNLVAVGIASWGAVQGKKSLINNDLQRRVVYKGDHSEKNCSSLDPNHSHFFLVDDGTEHKFGGEIKFRAKFEAHLSKNGSDNAAKRIPVVSVMVGGGSGTLKTVHNAIKVGTPVVIIEGSGRAADILARAYMMSKRGSSKTDLSKNVEDEVKQNFPNVNEKSVGELVTGVLECLDEEDLINIFHLDPSDSDSKIDEIILQALLQVNKDNNDKLMQLKLALAWNSIDATKNIQNKQWKLIGNDEMNKLMVDAILENKVDFVKLFMQVKNGVQLFKFVTSERLSRLYKTLTSQNTDQKQWQEIVGGVLEQWLVVGKHEDKKNTDNRIFKWMKELWSSVGTGIKVADDKQIMLLLLFLWAVIKRRLALAKLFWAEIKVSGIAAALLAVKLLNEKYCDSKDPAEKTELLELAAYFEGLAVGVLKQCFDKDKRKARQLLTRKMDSFCGRTTLEVAVDADSKMFIEHPACQNLLDIIWRGKLELDNKGWQIFLCMLIPFITLKFISFRDDAWDHCDIKKTSTSQGEVDTTNCGSGETDAKQNASYGQKYCAFYSSPIVVFLINALFHAVFLVIFNVVLLADVPQATTLWLILCVWIVAMIAEEFRQMKDTFSFIIILMVFVVAYGATLQAIIYPNSKLSWTYIIGAIFKKPLFQIDGEHFLEELDGSMECNASSKQEYSRCPENTQFLPIVMEVLYILFTSILMLNLLIAKFSYTFQKIQQNVNQVWCSQRYNAIKEYYDRPPLPPPFILFYLGIQLCVKVCCTRKVNKEETDNPFYKIYPEPVNSELVIWELIRSKEYLRQEHRRMRQNTTNDRISVLEKEIAALREAKR